MSLLKDWKAWLVKEMEVRLPSGSLSQVKPML